MDYPKSFTFLVSVIQPCKFPQNCGLCGIERHQALVLSQKQSEFSFCWKKAAQVLGYQCSSMTGHLWKIRLAFK